MKTILLRRHRAAGSHAGAWKVAYADFVTGMMSLFLVLWILSQDEEVIIATTRFFRDPYMAGVPKSTPVEQKDARPGSMVDQIVGRSDTTMKNTDDTSSIDIDVLHRIARDWFKWIKDRDLDDEAIEIEVQNERIHVTLYHGDDKPFFKDHSPELTDVGKQYVRYMSWAIDRHLLISRMDSHTNALPSGREARLALVGEPPESDPRRNLTRDDEDKLSAFKMSADQAHEMLRWLTYYAAPVGENSELLAKFEGIKAHGTNIANKRFPNQELKNRRVELSLVIDKSKKDLREYRPPTQGELDQITNNN